MKFATIGTGKIVRKFLAAGQFCEEMTPSVLYSRTRDHAQKLGRDAGLTEYEICTSLEKLKRSAGAEAVYVASPTYAHCSQSIQMMEGGKHVLCEKPAASNYREWERMQAAAKQHNVILLEAMRSLFTPGFAALRDNLYRVGTVRKVFIQYCQYSSRYDNFKNGIVENAFRPELSNGALMDIGIYCVELLAALFGMPERIQASAYILPGSIDGEGTILAGYPGMEAVLSYSKISDSGLRCEIQGEVGSLTWEKAGAPQNVIFIPGKGEKILLYGEPDIPDMAYEQRAFVRFCREAEASAGITKVSRGVDLADASGVVVPVKAADADRSADVSAGAEQAVGVSAGTDQSVGVSTGAWTLSACNEITAMSLKITDEARRQTGIAFPADEKRCLPYFLQK